MSKFTVGDKVVPLFSITDPKYYDLRELIQERGYLAVANNNAGAGKISFYHLNGLWNEKDFRLYSLPSNERLDNAQVGGDHYKKHKFSPWDIIDEYQLDFYAGNIIKYVLRAKDKNGVEDLKKARHYIDKLISIHEPKIIN